MRDGNDWFGLALYTPHCCAQSAEEWVRVALCDSGANVCGVQLAQISTVSTKGHLGKNRQVNEKSLADVLKRSAQGRVHSIYGYSVQIDPDTDLGGTEFFHFFVTVTPAYSSDVRRLIVKGPRAVFDQEAVVSYAQHLVARFGIDYGLIAGGLSRFHIDATTTYTHSVHVDDEQRLRQYGPDHPRKRFGREMSYYQSRRWSFDQYVPRASWGNVLSEKHVEALGGEDQVRRDSGAYLIERWGGSIYLQLTESLWSCSNADLTRLNRFLEPARFPGAPAPVYLDRSSDAYTVY